MAGKRYILKKGKKDTVTMYLHDAPKPSNENWWSTELYNGCQNTDNITLQMRFKWARLSTYNSLCCKQSTKAWNHTSPSDWIDWKNYNHLVQCWAVQIKWQSFGEELELTFGPMILPLGWSGFLTFHFLCWDHKSEQKLCCPSFRICNKLLKDPTPRIYYTEVVPIQLLVLVLVCTSQ